MTTPQRTEPAESCYGRFQIARMRHAYTSISGWRSDVPGYDGLIAELRWGLNNLDPAKRHRADRAVLTAVLGGEIPVTAIHLFGAFAPDAMAWLFAETTPDAFGFLVGKMERDGADALRIPRCRFASTAGRRVCLEVCRAPTQKFFNGIDIPLTMTPDMHSFECHWHYGKPAAGDSNQSMDANAATRDGS
jgi:hypothetical protein